MILAQEMRPNTFDEVIGNEHIVEPLRKQLADGRLSQSIMIIGHTGTGKTTVAYIIARELGAEVHEIDCGSDGGIDTIRGLIDSSHLTSLFADSKLFILDEVHKLSGSGQSALLKTLEEQREGVYFLLLTNEPGKVLKTIRTRCVVYETSPPSREHIGVAVNRVLEKYDITVENRKDFWAVVNQAEGSLRQVYALLEKLLAASDDNGYISSEVFTRTLGPSGYIEDEEPPQLASIFFRGTRREALGAVRELSRAGGVNPYAQALGVYNYLRAVYTKGTHVNTELMARLSSLLAGGGVEWMHIDSLAWEFLEDKDQ